jgi:glycosidase
MENSLKTNQPIPLIRLKNVDQNIWDALLDNNNKCLKALHQYIARDDIQYSDITLFGLYLKLVSKLSQHLLKNEIAENWTDAYFEEEQNHSYLKSKGFTANFVIDTAWTNAEKPSKEMWVSHILLNDFQNNPALTNYFSLIPVKEFQDSGMGIVINAIKQKSIDHHSSAADNSENDIDSVFSVLESLRNHAPNSIMDQILFMTEKWGSIFGDDLNALLILLDEWKASHKIRGGSNGSVETQDFSTLVDAENYTQDQNWMPELILLAKNAYVWLHQLSQKYNQEINTLDKIPIEELQIIASQGFSGLWLIGLWERSEASKKIKQDCGNPEAEASAYALKRYDIADRLGNWEALQILKSKCQEVGIKLASDMVPNHTAIDGDWVLEHPERFVSTQEPPFPSYSFSGYNLIDNEKIGLYLEDHYYSQSDASVVFKRVDFETGDTRYIYHGNDGTTMPWNDSAQLDLLNPDVREALIETILHVAQNFPIIRFDAAMTFAKKHFKRLWYPEPGSGGDIASRSRFGLSQEEFDQYMPEEFWREVVERVKTELPDTLLLAEAFWMMEGYFVRNLGMHRVYNSAFMHMIKDEKNSEYRHLIKTTLEYDPEILKRYVNFLNNPDEETAIVQFGDNDKYFLAATLLITLPGLPMFGHGQIEGFHEKYGMEYSKPYWDETPNVELLKRHENEIFPLMKKRYLFAKSEYFYLFPFHDNWNNVNNNVFAYLNGTENERVLVLANNSFEQCSGYLKGSDPFKNKSNGQIISKTFLEAMNDSIAEHNIIIFENMMDGSCYLRAKLQLHNDGFQIELRGYEKLVLSIKTFKETSPELINHLFNKFSNNVIPHLTHETLLFKHQITRNLIIKYFSKDAYMDMNISNMQKNTEQLYIDMKEYQPETGELPNIADLAGFVKDVDLQLKKNEILSSCVHKYFDTFPEISYTLFINILLEYYLSQSAQEKNDYVILPLVNEKNYEKCKVALEISQYFSTNHFYDLSEILLDSQVQTFLDLNEFESIQYFNQEKWHLFFTILVFHLRSNQSIGIEVQKEIMKRFALSKEIDFNFKKLLKIWNKPLDSEIG